MTCPIAKSFYLLGSREYLAVGLLEQLLKVAEDALLGLVECVDVVIPVERFAGAFRHPKRLQSCWPMFVEKRQ